MDLAHDSEASSSSSHTSFPIIAVAIIGIIATAFLLISYYIFAIKCCLNWHRIDLLRRFSFSTRRRPHRPLTEYSPAVNNRGLNESAIRAIPILNYYPSQNDACECAVCLNEFQRHDKLRLIPNCGHVFHIDCIDVWLQSNANCPLCRTSISGSMDQFLAPAITSPSPQIPSDEIQDFVVIEIGRDQGNSNLPIRQEGELRASRKKHFSSMGDEWIDMNRHKDEEFVVQPMRRSFSMDSMADTQLFLAVQHIMQSQVGSSEANRLKRSFFSFGQGGRASRGTVRPIPDSV